MLPTKSDTQRSRSLTHLTPTLDKVLLGYAAAAGAAGVGLLAVAQPAEAKIIYTPANIAIPENGGLIQFDINNDGIPDFGFYRASGTCEHGAGAHRLEGCSFASFEIIPAQASNEVAVLQNCAAELPAGITIGPNRNLRSNTQAMWWWGGDSTGTHQGCPWHNNKGGFLGLKFVVSGEVHYAWARVSLNGGATLTGYAYETVPNKPIHTGKPIPPGAVHDSDEHATVSGAPALSSPVLQPVSLGILARGASTLSAWRRREEMN